MSAAGRRRGLLQVLRGRTRDETGAASVEYAGILLIVVSIIVSVMMAATPVGASIAARLCEAFGATCGDVTAGEEDDQPDKPCLTSTDQVTVNGNVSIAFIDLGGERSVKIERFSDDSVRITVGGEAALQAVLSSPEAFVNVSVADYNAIAGLTGSVGGGVMVGTGLEYSFADEKSAADFTDWLTRQAVKEGLTVAASGPMTPGVGLAVEVGDWILRKITGYDYAPPSPTAWYVEGGTVVTAGGSIGDIASGAAGSFRAEQVLGMREGTDGSRTVYSRVEMTAAGLAQVGLTPSAKYGGVGASGNLGAELVIATTLDKNGKLVSVGLEGAATAEGATNLTALFGADPLSGGKGVQLSAEFPVTDANRAQVEASIAAIAAGSLVTGTGTANMMAAPFIFDEARRNGEVTAQFADVSSSNLLNVAVGLKAPAVGGLGLGLGAGTSESTTTGGHYLTDTGWKDWAACTQ